MNNYEKITIIANQLANAGKKPTTALIKGKLSSPVPLPQIIGTLKSWQHDPENCTFPTAEVATSSSEKESKAASNDETLLSVEQLNIAIENALAPIKAELAEVKALLQQLNKNS